MSFFTRPNFEDRQHVQYSGTSITLSGFTNINNTGYLMVKSQTLDFTGTTTASTQYNIAGVNGYINNGEFSSLIIEPPIILLSGYTGTTTVDVTGYVLTSLDSEGRVVWQTPTGSNSGNCVTDFYVSNLHGCSPITVWDQFQHTTCSATGQSSNAFGYNTKAYGDYSQALGNNTKALTDYTTVNGQNTISGGKSFGVSGYTINNGLIILNSSYGDVSSEYTYSSRLVLMDGDIYAFNLVYIDSVDYDVVLSATTIQLLDNTLNIGCTYVLNIDNLNNTSADNKSGYYSKTDGYNTRAVGFYSHAEGKGNFAIGNHSHAEGSYGESSINIALGHGSHAEGAGTLSKGDGSHAEGGGSISNGNYSHAEGESTTSNGYYSHSEGYNTVTNGIHSHAEGYATETYNSIAHTEGSQTKSFGYASHSEGINNISGLVYLNCEFISAGTGNYFYIDTVHGDVTNYFQSGDELFISDVNSNKNFLVSLNEYSIDGISYQEISPSVSGTVISILPDPGFPSDSGLFITNLTNLITDTAISNCIFTYGSHSEGSFIIDTVPNPSILGNISFGHGSHAEGIFDNSIRNVAYGLGSNAKGYGTKSIGNFSHASGINCYSDGESSFIHSQQSYIKNGENSSILGGYINDIIDSDNSTVLGGRDNHILQSLRNGIVGGLSNNILSSSDNSTILGGRDNTINLSLHSSILGGSDNTVGNSSNSIIVGGDSNTINGLSNVVMLGTNNLSASSDDTVYVPNLVVSQPYIPSSSGDTGGDVGNISWDETHLYIKTNTGWGRISLDYAW